MNLTGRRILVTGASFGIGRECCVALSELGARLVLVARNEERLNETKSWLTGEGHVAQLFDLNSTDDIPYLMKQIAEKGGALAGVAHCAGSQLTLPLKSSHSSQYEDIYRLNLIAGAMLVKGLRQKGVSTKPAAAVLISSIRALTGDSCISAYAASKGAVVSMVRSLAVELAAEEVRVNCVAPGYVKTAMTEEFKRALSDEQYQRLELLHPLGVGRPRDVANAVAFLLADTGRWITGTTLVVDGGFTAQ